MLTPNPYTALENPHCLIYKTMLFFLKFEDFNLFFGTFWFSNDYLMYGICNS